jgi:hypothetical protein
MTDAITHTGRCLCGEVRYVVTGPLRGVLACHCSQCRRTSGHYGAFTNAPAANLRLTAASSLSWYRSSPGAERGFCSTCGSNLFWREIGADTTSITAGTLDGPTGIAIDRHIFVADKSDYYTLTDGVAQSPAG